MYIYIYIYVFHTVLLQLHMYLRLHIYTELRFLQSSKQSTNLITKITGEEKKDDSIFYKMEQY